MVYLVILDWCYDGERDYEITVCETREKALACLKLQAEYEWAENWENMVDTIGDIESYEWTDNYVDFQNYDTRTTIYIVEKEIE